jgi:hypothetical protein
MATAQDPLTSVSRGKWAPTHYSGTVSPISSVEGAFWFVNESPEGYLHCGLSMEPLFQGRYRYFNGGEPEEYNKPKGGDVPLSTLRKYIEEHLRT